MPRSKEAVGVEEAMVTLLRGVGCCRIVVVLDDGGDEVVTVGAESVSIDRSPSSISFNNVISSTSFSGKARRLHSSIAVSIW